MAPQQLLLPGRNFNGRYIFAQIPNLIGKLRSGQNRRKYAHRTSGKYRYVWRNDETSAEFGSYGEHKEVVPVERIVTSELMDGLDGQPLNYENPPDVGEPAINTLTLTESGGGTILTHSSVFPSREIRDMAVQSGMTDGMGQSYDRLDGVLEARDNRLSKRV